MTNHCGSCTVCCVVMGISALDKPAGVKCSHCKTGIGCKIYADRPEECAGFECLWLASQKTQSPMVAKLRPDRSKVVMNTVHSLDGEAMLVLRMHPSYPDIYKTDRFFRRFVEDILETRKVSVVAATQDGSFIKRRGKDWQKLKQIDSYTWELDV